MTNLTKKSINELANRITNVKQGGLKQGVWTTKAANLINEGVLQVLSLPTDNTLIRFNDVEYSITPEALTLRALFEGFKGDIPIATLLELMQDEFLSSQQRESDTIAKLAGTTVKAVNPLQRPTKLLTSSEYKENCVALALDVANTGRIIALIDQVNEVTSKTTKDDLIHLLDSFKDVFFNTQQEETYQVMVDTEEAEAAKFSSLTKAGFTSIGRTALGNYTAKVSVVDSTKAIPELTSAGFKVVGSPAFDLDTMMLAVTFSEGEPTPLV